MIIILFWAGSDGGEVRRTEVKGEACFQLLLFYIFPRAKKTEQSTAAVVYEVSEVPGCMCVWYQVPGTCSKYRAIAAEELTCMRVTRRRRAIEGVWEGSRVKSLDRVQSNAHLQQDHHWLIAVIIAPIHTSHVYLCLEVYLEVRGCGAIEWNIVYTTKYRPYITTAVRCCIYYTHHHRRTAQGICRQKSSEN